jgi:hypothetical protein
VNVLKILELLKAMDPDRKKAVGDSIKMHVHRAINQEIVDKLIEAVEKAAAAGFSDDEIHRLVDQTLKRRPRPHILAQAIAYREAWQGSGSSGKSN